jgi:hypothetical protein
MGRDRSWGGRGHAAGRVGRNPVPRAAEALDPVSPDLAVSALASERRGPHALASNAASLPAVPCLAPMPTKTPAPSHTFPGAG